MYPTSLTDSQYNVIEKILNDKRKRKYSLRSVLDAILYISKTGVQWRMLPKEFPAWESVYYYFRKWKGNGTLELIVSTLRDILRRKHGKKESPSLAIVDSQTAKNSEWGLPDKGFDGNKKINGRKRHLAVDTLGFLLCVVVTEANINDGKAFEMVAGKMQGRFPRLRRILGDGAYVGEQVLLWARSLLKSVFEVATRSGEKGFEVIPKRWIVERSIGWLNWDRRLSKDYEANFDSSEAWVMISAIRSMIRKF